MTTVLPSDAATSGNGRAPSIAYRRIRAHYLIKASEMAASGYANGSSIGQIGWTYTVGGGTGTAGLIIYLQNTADVTNTKSTTWSTAISGMTVVHNNASTVIPAGLTPDIVFSGGSGFNYTGGGVYVAFDWGCYGGTTAATTISCNSLGLVNGLQSAQQASATPCPGTPAVTTAASSFRPLTRFGPALVPCTGTPTPGNTIASPNLAYPFAGQCPGVAFSLSLQNFTSGSGVTYQWQSADDAAFSVNLTNLGTASTQVTSQLTDKYYHCLVTCSGNTGTSNALLVTTQNSIYQCYCIPASSGTGFPITNVNFAGINNNNAIANLAYQDFTGSVAAGNVVTGTTVPISISATGLAPNVFAGNVFFDWNHNGVFTDVGEEVQIATSTLTPIVYTGNVTVPGGAFIGTTRMRVMHKFSTYSTSCFTGGNNLNAHDYLINITAPLPCITPAPGNTLSTSTSVCSGVSFTLSLQNATAGFTVTYQWQSADDAGFSVNLTNLGTASTQVTSQTASKYYRCQVTCSVGPVTTASNPILVNLNTDLCNCLSYCASTHTSGCASGDEITNVSIATTGLNNTSACAATQYTFFNGGGSQTGTMTIGNSYTVSITFGADGTQNSGVWIDYNNDGTFATAEFLGASAQVGGGATGTIAFTVPGTATTGSHRMRVVGGNDVAVLSTEACNASSSPWGETEDYCITLIVPAACSGTPAPGNTIASENPICTGKSFTLSLQNFTSGTGVTYQWECADDAGFTVNLVSLGTASTQVTSQTAAKYYRCQVTCSGNTTASNSLQVTMQTNPSACYCLGTTSLAGCTYGLDIESVIVAGINNTTTCGGSLPNMYTNYDYISGNVEQGLSYPITVGRSTFVNNACVFGVWVDWNNNYSFNDAGEYMAIFLTGGAGVGQQSNSGTLFVPAGATLGAHRMRIRSNFSTDPGQASVCANYANPSEQEDYTLNVVAQCTGTPVAGTTASFSALACPSVPFTLYIQGSSLALGLTYQWESSPDNIAPYVPIAGATNSSTIQTQQTSTYYRCVVTCSNTTLSSSSTPLQMNLNTFANCICNTPVYSSVGCTGTTANDYIGQVTFAGINNTTGCGATSPNYQFFGAQIANVNQTVTYPITISAPPAGSAFQRFKVFIDFNDNASFDDAGETVYNSGPISTGVNSSTGNISISAVAPLGSHRLRVRSTNPLSTNIDANSCSDDGFFGEVEDYTVVIAGPPPCSGTPTPGQTLASTPLACSSTSINLSLQNATSGTGVTYQWQSSADAVFTTPVNLGTNSTQTATQSVTSWYRCLVTCSGNTGTSTPVQVSSSVPCYCTNPVHGSDGCALGLYIDNFTFAGINNTSGCYSSVPYTTPFYSYFPNATANVGLGVSYPFSITTPVQGAFTQWFGIYIDYNDNGSFDDAGELVAQTNPTISTAVNTFSGTILIPNTSAPGTHKMRIRSGNAAPLNSCSAASSGETEDYNLIIAPPANSVSSNGPVCVGSTLNLSALPNGATSYLWTGPGITGANQSQQNPSISNVTLADAGLYTCSIVIFGFTYTPSVTVVVNALPSVSASNDAPFCSGTADLHLTSTAPTAITYLWTGLAINGGNQGSPNPTITAATSSINGTYNLTVTDANNCSNTTSTVVGIYALPPVLVTVIGSNNLCTGQTTSDLQATGAVGYSWSTFETTSLITVSTQGTYTVTGTDIHNCVNTDVAVITESAPPAAPVISPAGPVVLCTDGFTTTSASLTVTNYSNNLLWSTSETDQTISINYADIFNVTYTDGNGCYSVSNPVSSSVDNYSTAPTSVTSNAPFNNICVGNTVTLNMVGGTLGDNAQWKWYEGGCGTGASFASGPNPTITPTVGSHTYFVRSESVSCGNTVCASITITVSPGTALATVHYTASTGVGCNGSFATFSVNAVPGAAFYNWSGTSGALYNGVPGPVQTASNSVTVTFATPPPAGASGYNICCFAGNACASSNTICTWVRAKVSQPGTISGGLIACPSTGSVYSVANVVGADTYTWTITGNANINGGGSSLTTASPSITVNFLGGWSSGTLSVYASMNCGFNSATRNLGISSTPSIPGTMSGPGYVCPSASSSFSVSAVPGAASYNWTTNVPLAVVTPAGNTASIAFPAVIPAGSQVCVTSISSCGAASPQRCKSVASGIPNIPGNISGPSTGQCGQTGVSYSITPVFGATSYLWSTSTTQATISGPNNLSSASLNFTSSFSSVSINVVAISACGSSPARTLSVNGFPGLPAAITGNAAPCSTLVESYATPGASGATSYNWTVPAGSTIIGGQGSANISVMIGSTAGLIGVTASNDCGTSGTRTFAIGIPCRQGQVENSITSANASLYPNPTSGKTTLKFESMNAAKYVISVVDVTGRIIISDEMTAAEGINMHELDLTQVSKGIYLVRMETAGEQTQLLKVTVE
ncbi:MAG: GEVED domain-containing protein [Bacteroidetes bacterium]|nr:GEVED domain-containing protein [Bacteroidota bacterium]